jgi:hypothetical protein
MRVKALGALAARSFDLGFLHARLDDADHPLCDVILQVEYVFEAAVEFVGPQMRAAFGLDQLHRDPHSPARLSDAAIQQIAHAQLASNQPDVDGLAFARRCVALYRPSAVAAGRHQVG